MCVLQTGIARLLTAGCLLVLFVQWSMGQSTVNYALNQPAYEVGTFSTSYASKAVDGGLNRDLANCACAAPDSALPWWTVKLAKWIQITSFVAYGRGDYPAETRDINYSYMVGRFWNDSLPNGVPASDPNDYTRNFTRIFTDTTLLNAKANLNVAVNRTDAAIGRYFAVKSALLANLMMLCEVQVYGQPSALSGSSAIAIVSDYAPYSSYNSSLLADDRDETCLSFFAPSNAQVVVLRFPQNTTSSLRVFVLMKGSVRVDTTQTRSCSPGVALRVAMRRSRDGGWAADYVCNMANTETNGASSLYTFMCTCTDCMSDVSVYLENNGVVTTVDVCEVLVFAA